MNIKLPNSVLYPPSIKQQPEIRHQVGNVYHIDSKDTSVDCVLAQVGRALVTPICLENNTNRWTEPVEVKTAQEISEKEFAKICGDNVRFTYVGRLEDVLKITPVRHPEDVLINRIFGEEK